MEKVIKRVDKMSVYVHKVQYYETDKMQITHHSNYIRFMEEARLDFFDSIGYDYAKVEKEGFISPVVRVECDYKKTTTYPDTIEIEVKAKECKKFKFKLGYTMTVSGNVVCTAQSTHCFLDMQGRPVNIEKTFPGLFEKLSVTEK